MPKIALIGMRGLLGDPAPGGLAYSTGIDAMFTKAVRLDPVNVVSNVFSHTEDTRVYAAMKSFHARGYLLVLSGHSLGARDVVKLANSFVSEIPRATIPLLFTFDPTWNAPAPPVGRGILRAINHYGTAASALGHDQLEPGKGFNGKLVNIGVAKSHVAVDDDLGAHTMFIREIRWLLTPSEGSATPPQPIKPVTAPAKTPLAPKLQSRTFDQYLANEFPPTNDIF